MSVTWAVTLIVVIAQSFVTVMLTVASDVDPEATTWPRTATVQVHGTSAPDGLTVSMTRDLFFAAS